MNAITKAVQRSAGISEAARVGSSGKKAADFGDALSSIGGGTTVTNISDQGKYQYRYNLFRGWLYSAVHALASKGAGQDLNLGILTESASYEEDRGSRLRNKQFLLNKMTTHASSRLQKSPNLEVEVLARSPILDALEKPNDIQDRWQFTYLFIANLALTGWSYVVIDTSDEGKLEFYSIPTTWVTPLPDDKGNPFGKFKIKNPKKGDVEGQDFDKEHVAFAYLPNPSDPLAAYAPSSAQLAAIQIDDKIQTSQDAFFDNGIFPNAVVTVGKNPHPDVPGGIRPRLTAAQRRQVHGVIGRMMRGVNKYGNPAIVDGYIESVTPFSLTQNEMGWDKSEDKVRSRILSAYGVHPYILGEPVGVGGYAQVAGIERVFCDRVNTYINMLGNVLTNKLVNLTGDGNLLVWWDKCEPLDPNVRNSMLKEARKNGDITRDEYRAELGLSPMREGSDRSKLLENPVVFSSMLKVQSDLGLLDAQTLAEIYQLYLGITSEEAASVTGSSSKSVEHQILKALGEVAASVKEQKILLDKTEVDENVGRILDGVHS